MRGCSRCMGGEGLRKGTVMRNQLLPDDFGISAEMPEQDRCLLLPVLPALAGDDSRETARQDPDTVNNMAQCVSEFCRELSAFAVKIGPAHGGLGRPRPRGLPTDCLRSSLNHERKREINLSIQPALAYEDMSAHESSAEVRMAAQQ